MKKTTSAAVAVLLAVSLSACVPKALEVAPGPTHVPAVAPVAAQDARQAWADEQITLFLNGNGAASFRGFTDGTAQREIASWNSPKPGVLNVVIANGDWDEGSLEHVGWDIMTKSGWETPELELVRVATQDGKLSVDYNRTDARGMNSAQTTVKPREATGSQERADKIMDLFLKSYDRTDFKEFSIDTPHRAIKEWYLKDDKTFVIIVGGQPSTFWLANDFLERVYEQGEIEKVTVLDKDNYGASRTLADLNLA